MRAINGLMEREDDIMAKKALSFELQGIFRVGHFVECGERFETTVVVKRP